MTRYAVLALPLLAAALSACGSGRDGESELMRRVSQAEEAARRAEAAADKAEAAALRAGGGGSPSPAPTVYEPAPDMDAEYGQGTEPVPDEG